MSFFFLSCFTLAAEFFRNFYCLFTGKAGLLHFYRRPASLYWKRCRIHLPVLLFDNRKSIINFLNSSFIGNLVCFY